MDIFECVRNCLAHANEIEKFLAEDGVFEETARQLSKFSVAQWDAWRASHAEEISTFVESSPAKRAKLVRWREIRHLLCFAALQHINAADFVLRTIHWDLIPGGSDREIVARAGDLFYKSRVKDIGYCYEYRTSLDLLSRLVIYLKP